MAELITPCSLPIFFFRVFHSVLCPRAAYLITNLIFSCFCFWLSNQGFKVEAQEISGAIKKY